MKDSAVTHHRWASWSRTIFALAAVSACSAHSAVAVEPADAGGLAADRFAASLAEALCGSIGPCCTASGVTFDAGRCIAAATALVGFELTSPARTLGATYHADAAAQCIAQMTAAVPGCGAGTLEGAGWASACSSVYTGTKKPGESCTSSVECAPVTGGTVSCVAWTAAIPGPDGGSSSQTGQSCQVHLPGVAGLICRSPQNAPPSTTVYDCDPATNNGLTCNEQSGTCEVRVGPGVSCGADTDCLPDSYCAYGEGGPSCAARIPLGQSCGQVQFANVECVAGAYCTYPSRMCVPLLAPGDACDEGGGCAFGCNNTGRCAYGPLAESPLCGG